MLARSAERRYLSTILVQHNIEQKHTTTRSYLIMDTHLDQLHDQIELVVSVYLLYEQHDIWMFDPT